MSAETDPANFKEVQRFSQWWIWLIVYSVALLAWVGFIQQIIFARPFGTNPAPDWAVWLILIFIGFGLPVLFHTMRLIIEVSPAGILVHYVPFTRRTIAFADIKQVQVRTCQPIKEYGGWGVRGWSNERRAYNVKGNEGVELSLLSGQKIMLGSQRAQELAEAINAQRKQA